MKWATSLIVFATTIFLLSSCAIVPQNIENHQNAPDSSTPAQYNTIYNNGILFSIPEKGKVQYLVITPNKRNQYNELIIKYQKRFYEKKQVLLKKDDGVTTYIDKYGNSLYKIDAEHVKYFMILLQWNRNSIPKD